MSRAKAIECLECDFEIIYEFSVDEFGYVVDDDCPDTCPNCNSDLNYHETNFPEDFCKGT